MGRGTGQGLGEAALADGLDLDRLQHDCRLRGGEPEPGPMAVLEGGNHRLVVIGGHLQRSVGALIAQEEAGLDTDVGQPPVGGHLGVGRRGQLADVGGDGGQQVLGEREAHGPLGHRAHVGQADAQRGEHPGVGMDQHGGHAQLVGHPAGVLAAGPAEAGQRVGAHVVAPLHRDGLDGVGHVLHGHGQEPLGGPLGAPRLAGGLGDRSGELGERPPGRGGVEGLIAVGAEHRGEVVGVQPPEHHVGVGHGERPAVAVASGAGLGPRRVGSHPEAAAVERQDRATPGGHGVNQDHRSPHPDPGHHRVGGALEVAVVVGHIGGGAAHVEPDQAAVPGGLPGAGHAHHPTGRAGQQRILAPEVVGVGEAPVGLHEEERRVHLILHGLDVTAQHRGEIGVGHGGVAPGHQADERVHLMAGRDVLEAHLSGDLGQAGLVVGVAVAVQQHDGRRAQAVPVGRGELAPGVVFVEPSLHGAVGPHPLVHGDHPAVHHVGQHDVEGEQVGTGLVADAEGVGEPLGGDQHGGLARPFQQGVGGHRGAHLHLGHRSR